MFRNLESSTKALVFKNKESEARKTLRASKIYNVKKVNYDLYWQREDRRYVTVQNAAKINMDGKESLAL